MKERLLPPPPPELAGAAADPATDEVAAAGNSSRRKASLSGAVFNVSTSIIGAGIMSMPAAMRVLGVAPLAVLLAATAVLFDHTVEFLLRYTRESGGSTYAGVVGESFGAAGSAAVQACVAVNNAGVLVVYLIIIGDVVSGSRGGGVEHPGLLPEWFGEHWWVERPVLLLVVVVLVLLPLALHRQIDSLRFSSAMSVLLALVFLCITTVMAIYCLIQGTTTTPRLLPDMNKNSFFDLFAAVPVVLLAFTFHFNVHPIRAELKQASDMKSAVRISLLLCSVVYAAVAISGYLLFGESTMSDILSNFDRSSGALVGPALNDAVRLSYAFHLVLVFPVLFFSLRLNIYELLFVGAGPDDGDDAGRFLTLTGVLLSLIYLAAIVVPDIWSVFQIVGSSSAVCISLVFPGAVALLDIHGISSGRDKVLAGSMIALAVVTSSVAIASNVIAYLH